MMAIKGRQDAGVKPHKKALTKVLLKPTAIDNVKFESIHGLGRLYQITATIDPGGKATLVWKLRKDRP